MVCPDCGKQIPDDSERCPYCEFEIDPREQVQEEIKRRRRQRLYFYIIILVLFLAMLGIVVYMYYGRIKLTREMSQVNVKLKSTETDLTIKEKKINEIREELDKQIKELQDSLTKKSDELDKKTEEYKITIESREDIENKRIKCEGVLEASEANIYNLILKLGKGITNSNLRRIPVANNNFEGEDTDGDGLSDVIEFSFGTDPGKADTDDDGYSDKDEILVGYNPTGAGSWGIDTNFAEQQKGKILLQIENAGEAWYVSPQDGRRYFLGRAEDGYALMRDLEYWAVRQ